MRIVFMGTPPFAVPTLQALLKAGHDIPAVITAPDRPAGRGQQQRESAVKQFARAEGLPVLQPTNLKAKAFQQKLAALEPDIQVVVAFRMLPEGVWALPPLGTLNLHASLLPDYRGAAPINWVLINGEEETGLTTFRMDREIDTGGILLQERVRIPPEMTAGELHDQLMIQGAQLVAETLQQLAAGTLTPTPQDERAARHRAPKLSREDGLLHWNLPPRVIHNHIRGLSPRPGAWTHLQGRPFKIYRSRVAPEVETPPEAGRLLADAGSGRLFAAGQNGWLELLEVQQEGRKRLPASEFVRGLPVADAWLGE